MIRVTVKKRMRSTLKAIREKLRVTRHKPLAEVGKWLGRVVQGYFNYYGIPGNIYRLNSFRKEACRAWQWAIKRRSQRKRLSGERFYKLVSRYLSICRNTHPYPDRRFWATTQGKSLGR